MVLAFTVVQRLEEREREKGELKSYKRAGRTCPTHKRILVTRSAKIPSQAPTNPYTTNKIYRNNTQSMSHHYDNGSSSIAIILDSLPYIDTIHPEYEHQATELMEQEMRQQPPPSAASKLHPRVIQSIQPPPSSSHDTQQQQQQQQQSKKRRRRSQEEEILDNVKENPTNISLPQPQQRSMESRNTKLDIISIILDESFPSKPKDHDSENNININEWKITIQKARIAYEKERIRSMELEVDQDTLSDVWKQYHAQLLEPQLLQYQQLLQDQEYKVTKINYERHEHQTKEYQPTLAKLQYQYHDVLQKIVTLQNAIQSAK